MLISVLPEARQADYPSDKEERAEKNAAWQSGQRHNWPHQCLSLLFWVRLRYQLLRIDSREGQIQDGPNAA